MQAEALQEKESKQYKTRDDYWYNSRPDLLVSRVCLLKFAYVGPDDVTCCDSFVDVPVLNVQLGKSWLACKLFLDNFQFDNCFFNVLLVFKDNNNDTLVLPMVAGEALVPLIDCFV